MTTTRFVLGGVETSVSGEELTPLYPHVLPHGAEEGACTDRRCLRCLVIVADRVVASCMVPLFRVEGAVIKTRADLVTTELGRAIERAFLRVGIDECPAAYDGLFVLAYHLIGNTQHLSEAAIRRSSHYVAASCVSREQFEHALRLAERVYRRVRRGR